MNWPNSVINSTTINMSEYLLKMFPQFFLHVVGIYLLTFAFDSLFSGLVRGSDKSVNRNMLRELER